MCIHIHTIRTPAFLSSLLSPGQRLLSVNHQRARREYLDAYQSFDVGAVGFRVTYVVDIRSHYTGLILCAVCEQNMKDMLY